MRAICALRNRHTAALSGLTMALGMLAAGCEPPPEPPPELPDLGGRAVTVAVLADYLPYSQIDPQTGAVNGWDYDLVTALASKLNFTPQFVAVDPHNLAADLAAQRYDIAGGGIASTAQRAEQFDFAAAYRLVKQRVAVRAADSRVATIAEFHDDATLRVGTVPGTTTYDTAVAYLGTERVVGFDTYSAALDALVAGEVDGVVLDDIDLSREQHRAEAFRTLPGPIAGDVLAYALPKGSDLTAPIQAAFDELMSDGTVADLREKWGL